MKTILSTLIGLILAVSARAECGRNNLRAFPNGKTINQNAIFILEGYAESQRVILGLNKTHSIYLKSGNKRVNLRVSEVCVGEYNLTQALLKPESELEAGLEYTMHIDNLPKYEFFNRYNRETKEHEPVTYKVIGKRDLEKPILSDKPKELKKTLVAYGCGPSKHVVFSNPARDSSEIFVKTTVKNLKTGTVTTYYLVPEDDKIEVGHTMCSGAFKFKDGDNYEVEFTFIDSSGNLKAWSGPRIKFTKPTEYSNED